MSTKAPLLFFFFFLLAVTLTNAVSTSTIKLFIKNSCNTTRYPDLCYSSLSKYTSEIQQSQFQLTQVATNVSLTNLKSAASTATTSYNQELVKTPVNNRTVKALKDCKSLLSDAIDNTKYCISQLSSLQKGGVSGSQMQWGLFNVQTYMSAVLTKEDTCIDGLKEMEAVVSQVSTKVLSAEQYSSNALALANCLRSSYQ